MKVVLDAEKMQTREAAHAHLKEMLELPEYYGRNLDALYDCLSDIDDVEVEIQHGENENNYIRKIWTVMKEAGVKFV